MFRIEIPIALGRMMMCLSQRPRLQPLDQRAPDSTRFNLHAYRLRDQSETVAVRARYLTGTVSR